MLENVEDPAALLAQAAGLLAPGGHLFVNASANSSAPDHMFLFHDPETGQQLVLEAGLEIAAARAFPASGCSEARARKHCLTLNAVILARRPA